MMSKWCCIFCGGEFSQFQDDIQWCCWVFGSKLTTAQTNLRYAEEPGTYKRHTSVLTKTKCCLPGILHCIYETSENSKETTYRSPICCSSYHTSLYGQHKFTNIKAPCYTLHIHETVGAAKVSPEPGAQAKSES